MIYLWLQQTTTIAHSAGWHCELPGKRERESAGWIGGMPDRWRVGGGRVRGRTAAVRYTRCHRYYIPHRGDAPGWQGLQLGPDHLVLLRCATCSEANPYCSGCFTNSDVYIVIIISTDRNVQSKREWQLLLSRRLQQHRGNAFHLAAMTVTHWYFQRQRDGRDQ